MAGGWHDEYFPSQPDQQYYGRGALQLTWQYNYARFSAALNMDATYNAKMRLLEEPDLVHEDGFLAIASSLWFYMTPMKPKPSMHDVMTGFFEPNQADLDNGLDVSFGTTINIINGENECNRSVETAASQRRASYYTRWLEFFSMPLEGEGLTCSQQVGYFPW